MPKPLQAGDTIRLPNHFVRMGLQVSTPYFGDPYNLQIFYALEGEDGAAWLPMENTGIITFSRLRSGPYTLRIRKING